MLSYKVKNRLTTELYGWYKDKSTCKFQPGETKIIPDNMMSDIIWGWVNAKVPLLIVLETIKPVVEEPVVEPEATPEVKKETTAKAVKKVKED